MQHTVNSYRNLARHACMESERCMLNYERHKQRRRYLYTAKVRLERTGHRDIRSLQKYERPDIKTKTEISKYLDCGVSSFKLYMYSILIKGKMAIFELVM